MGLPVPGEEKLLTGGRGKVRDVAAELDVGFDRMGAQERRRVPREQLFRRVVLAPEGVLAMAAERGRQVAPRVQGPEQVERSGASLDLALRERGPGHRAETLALPRTSVTLVSGHGGREKIVELTGVGPTLIERRLASAAGEDRGRKERR